MDRVSQGDGGNIQRQLTVALLAKRFVQGVPPDHTEAQVNRPSSSYLRPQQTAWHRFLDELCYLCDFENGGQTVRALAVEYNDQAIFWLATARGSTDTVVSHLCEILGRLKSSVELYPGGRWAAAESAAASIFILSVQRSSTRVKEYQRHLAGVLEKLMAQSEIDDEGMQGRTVLIRHRLTGSVDRKSLSKVRNVAELRNKHVELCDEAYFFRQTLAYKRIEHQVITSRNPLWRQLHHAVNRLGSFMRAAQFLSKNAETFQAVLWNFAVRVIERPNAWKRDLKPGSDQDVLLKHLCGDVLDPSLHELAKHKLMGEPRVMADITKACEHGITPIVHPEVALMHHFYINDLEFFNRDRYIGCSKASCYSCSLYFDAHPAQICQRPCHGNVYVKWSPPLSDDGRLDVTNAAVIKSMLRSVQGDMRVHILQSIYGQKQSRDSSTAITRSARWTNDTTTVADADADDGIDGM